MSQIHQSFDFSSPGPYRAEDIRSGEPWDLSNGHLVPCPPPRGQAAVACHLGASVISAASVVHDVGIDTGFSPEPRMLRGLDVAVAHLSSEPGWVSGVPALGIEYVDIGEDEEELQRKIADLLSAGTKYLWIVRLDEPRHVEVYEHGLTMRTARAGEYLRAEGVLRNSVLVESLWDRAAAESATLTNLLQRRGYENLDSVLDAGREEGRLEIARSALLLVLSGRGLEISPQQRAQVEVCTDLAILERWLMLTAVATKKEEVFV